jgi:hypothetical protein
MTSKAVIIGANRTGGTFLASCLSNHPDIRCPRGEVFHARAVWQQRLSSLGHAELLDFVLSEPFYQVCMCRLTYTQALNPEVSSYLLGAGVKVIHLVREELVTVTSALLAKVERKDGKTRHAILGEDGADDVVDDEVLYVGPEVVLRAMRQLRSARAKFEQVYGGADMLLVRYEEMISGGHLLDGGVAARVCAFLGVVPIVPLWARNRKMHKRALSTYYARWPEIKAVCCEP